MQDTHTDTAGSDARLGEVVNAAKWAVLRLRQIDPARTDANTMRQHMNEIALYLERVCQQAR